MKKVLNIYTQQSRKNGIQERIQCPQGILSQMPASLSGGSVPMVMNMKPGFIIELLGVGIVHSVQGEEFVRKIVSKLLTLE